MNKRILVIIATVVTSYLTLLKAHAIDWKNYDHLDPDHQVPTQPLQQALAYYDQIKDKITNPNFLTIIDFSQHSKQKRFHLINMKTGYVESLLVAHGQGSDNNHDGWAERFSNKANSKASSLGFYLTSTTYKGKHGLSLTLDGLSATNSNARVRAVVVHGANYVGEKLAKIGRSWGCPALDQKIVNRIIQTIKEGSLMYAWAGQKPKDSTAEL